ncbi:MAG: ATP-binding protein [Nitrospinota bacterium]|nr:ATP-binding protein [Nitrospinota bacterium]
MFTTEKGKDTILFRSSAEMRTVDRVVQESKPFLSRFGAAENVRLKVVIRELLINAIEHGCGGDSSQSVECEIEYLGGARFRVTVEDSGAGFDYSSIDWKIPGDPQQERHRGFGLVNTLADEVEFNEKGNRVTAFLGDLVETDFKTEDKKSSIQIIPTGDITANVADKLRLLLIRALDEKKFLVKIDMKNVNDIDSIGISVLISFTKMLEKKNKKGKLKLMNTNKDIHSLFRLIKIDEIIAVSVS